MQLNADVYLERLSRFRSNDYITLCISVHVDAKCWAILDKEMEMSEDRKLYMDLCCLIECER